MTLAAIVPNDHRGAGYREAGARVQGHEGFDEAKSPVAVLLGFLGSVLEKKVNRSEFF